MWLHIILATPHLLKKAEEHVARRGGKSVSSASGLHSETMGAMWPGGVWGTNHD